jgi:hypothetical protein
MVYGDGILNDVTSVGVHRRPISDYFDSKSYMCVVPLPEGTDLESARRFMDRALGARYNYLGVVLLGLHILIGNNPSFSWRAVADILLVFGAVGLFIYFRTGQFSLITVGAGATYAAVVIFNRWRQSRSAPLERRRRES